MDIALEAFAPGLVTWLRIGFGCVTLWTIPVSNYAIPKEDRRSVAVLGVLWMAFPLSMFPIAQQWIDSSLAGMLNAGMPIFVAITGILFFGSKAVPKQIAGVAIGLIGILVIGIPNATAAGTTALGVGLVMLAVISYGFAANIAGPLQRTYGSVLLLRWALLAATILTAPLGIAGVLESTFEPGPLLACVILGIGGTGVAYVSMATLVGKAGAVRASVVTYLIPIVAIALGVAFRNEALSLYSTLGTTVVLAGAWITTQGSLKT